MFTTAVPVPVLSNSVGRPRSTVQSRTRQPARVSMRVQVGLTVSGGSSNATDTPSGAPPPPRFLPGGSVARARLLLRHDGGDLTAVHVQVDVDGLDLGAGDVEPQLAAAGGTQT